MKTEDAGIQATGPRAVGPHRRVWDVWNYDFSEFLFSRCSDCAGEWEEGDYYPPTCEPVDG